MDNLHYLGRNILLYIIWYWDTKLTILIEFYCSINCLKKTLLINTCNDEITLINCLRTLS